MVDVYSFDVLPDTVPVGEALAGELGAAALFKLQVKQNDIRRVEVVDRQLEKDIVSLLKRFIFGQAIVYIHIHDSYPFNI